MELSSRFSRRTLILVALASSVGLVAFGWAMREVMKPLHPAGIVDLELAFTPANAADILADWGSEGQAAARRSLLLDVGFILAGYAPLLASLCLLVARTVEGRKRRLGERLALGALGAGLLDLVENAALWGVIGQPADPPVVLTAIAGAAATIKFVLVVLASVYVLAIVSPLLQWILTAPVLFFIAVLVLAVLWRAALTAMGIPDLFWSDRLSIQFWAGIAVGALLNHLGVLGFLLDTQRASARGDDYWAAWCGRVHAAWVARVFRPGSETPAMLAGYLARTSLPLVAIAMLSALRAPGGVPRWLLPITTLVAFLVAAGLSISLSYRKLWIPAPPSVRRQVETAKLPRLHSIAYASVVLQAGTYLVLMGAYHLFRQGVSVAIAVCLLLGLLASAYGYLRFFFPAYVYGWLFGGLFAYVGLNALGGHRLPDLDYHKRVPLTDPRLDPRPMPGATGDLASWAGARAAAAASPPAGATAKKPPLVVVAVDGGGIRAAVWTTIVMAQLERDVPSLPFHVRIVTGASGGMVGIASYVGSLQPPTDAVRHRDLAGNAITLDQLVDRVAADSLGTVARELVFTDVPFPPFLHPVKDRGLALERAWEESTGILRQRFSDLAAGEAAGWRPSLIMSPLIVEDGRRLIISNLDVRDLVTVPGHSPSLQAIEYFGHLEPRPGKLRLSTAARLNASFPYVSPAAELPTKPARHTLDAGYYDEHGVELAGTWIWTHREWLKANAGGVLLVQVPDTRTRARKREADRDRRDWWAAGLLGATGPVEALLTANGAAADYRNDRLVRVLDETLDPDQKGFFETVVFEPEKTKAEVELPGCGRGGREAAFQEVALSWRLTRCEVSRLKESIRGGTGSDICNDRIRFQDWWNARRGESEPAVAVACPPPPL